MLRSININVTKQKQMLAIMAENVVTFARKGEKNMLNEDNKKMLDKLANSTLKNQDFILNLVMGDFLRDCIRSGIISDEYYKPEIGSKRGRSASPPLLLLKSLEVGQYVKLPAREEGEIHVRAGRLGYKLSIKRLSTTHIAVTRIS